jgi:hypothetical protein
MRPECGQGLPWHPDHGPPALLPLARWLRGCFRLTATETVTTAAGTPLVTFVLKYTVAMVLSIGQSSVDEPSSMWPWQFGTTLYMAEACGWARSTGAQDQCNLVNRQKTGRHSIDHRRDQPTQSPSMFEAVIPRHPSKALTTERTLKVRSKGFVSRDSGQIHSPVQSDEEIRELGGRDVKKSFRARDQEFRSSP